MARVVDEPRVEDTLHSYGPLDGVIAEEELRPGDVLLCRGRGWLAWGISFFDGSDYGHAALCLGDGEVVEALPGGVTRRARHVALAAQERVLVRRLAAPVPTLEPVLAKARQQTAGGTRWMAEPLLLLAHLAATRRVKLTAGARWTVRRILDSGSALLNSLVTGGQGREPLGAAELVHRCLAEGVPEAYVFRYLPFPAGGRGLLDASGAERPPGRAAHPASLAALALARAQAPVVRARELSGGAGSATVETLAPGTTAYETQRLDLERLLRAYAEEVRTTGPVDPPPPVDPAAQAALQAAVERFAILILAVRAAASSRGSARAATLAADAFGVRSVAPMALAELVRTAPHFVSPKDLMDNEALYTVGRVEGK